MKAVRMHGPDTLVFEAAPDPVARPGEVVVELKAAALNRRDTLVTRGVYPFELPLIPGSDGAGIRRDTGEEVVIYPLLGWGDAEEAPAPGYQILGGPTDGTYAELVRVPEANVLPRPSRLSWQEAAAFPLAALTAYRALFPRAGLRAGETVLILGAGSGASTLAVQLAHQAGARVLVTSSSQAKIDRARELGADGGVLYTDPAWPAAVRDLGPVDVVVDSVGATWQQSLDCLRPGGRCVVFGGTGGTQVELDVRTFYFGQFSLLGTTMGSPRDFAALLGMVERGDWRPVIDSTFPLADAKAAQEHLLGGGHFGKIVLDVA